MEKKEKLVFGFDMGNTSVGWAAIKITNSDLHTMTILDMGSRCFSEPLDAKKVNLLNMKRRSSRSLRRRLRRRKFRLCKVFDFLRKQFLADLSEFSYLKPFDPSEKNSLEPFREVKDRFFNTVQQKISQTMKNVDEKKFAMETPYYMRQKALNGEKIKEYELVYILYHYVKHRGYKSSKIDKEQNKEESQKNTETALIQNETDAKLFSLNLYNSQEEKVSEKTYRFRGTEEKDYCRVKQVDMEKEMRIILDNHKTSYSKPISEEWIENFIKMGFHRFPIKSFEDKVGPCSLFKEEKRAPEASFFAEKFSIFDTLGNIRLGSSKDQKLNLEQKIAIWKEVLNEPKGVNWNKFRKILQLDKTLKINFDDKESTKKTLKIRAFHKIKETLPEFLDNFSVIEDMSIQHAINLIAHVISCYKEDSQVKEELTPHSFDSTDEKNSFQKYVEIFPEYREQLKDIFEKKVDLNRVCTLNFSGHFNYSLKALNIFLNEMLTKNADRSEAEATIMKDIEPVQYFDAGEQLPSLCESSKRYQLSPPLSPIIQRTISQFIKVFNALVHKHGQPDEVHFELLRDLKLSKKAKENLNKRNNERRKKNDFAKEEANECGLIGKKDPLKILLLKEQKYRCAYSLKTISMSDIKNDEVEIDHIIPYQCSHDNSLQNKVLVFSNENRKKGMRTPHEYFMKNNPQRWEIFKNFVNQKDNEFSKKKKENLLCEDSLQKIVENLDFSNRHLSESGYIAKFIKNYVQNIYFGQGDQSDIKNQKRKVLVSNGRVTSLFRKIFDMKKFRTFEEFENNRLYKKKHYSNQSIDAKIPENSTEKTLSVPEKNPAEKAEEAIARERLFNEYLIYHGEKHHSLDALFVSMCSSNLLSLIGKHHRNISEKLLEQRDFSNDDLTSKILLHRLRQSSLFPDHKEFQKTVSEKLSQMIVSRRPRRSLSGELHEETVYREKVLENGKKKYFVSGKKSKNTAGMYKINRGFVQVNSPIRTDIFKHTNAKGKSSFILCPVYPMFVKRKENPLITLKKEIDPEWKYDPEHCQYLFSLHKDDAFEYTSKDGKVDVLYYVSIQKESNKLEYRFTSHKTKKQKFLAIKKLESLRKMEVDVLGQCHPVKKQRPPWEWKN